MTIDNYFYFKMASNEAYEEFKTYSEQMTDLQNKMTQEIALAKHALSRELLIDENCELHGTVMTIDDFQSRILQVFNKLTQAAARAYISMNETIGTINDCVSDINNHVDDLTEENAQEHMTTQNKLSVIESMLNELKQMNTKQANEIKQLKKTISPPVVTSNNELDAKYLIENVKNKSGKSIKGASITVDNVAAILAYYDKYKSEDVLIDLEPMQEPAQKVKPKITKIRTKK